MKAKPIIILGSGNSGSGAIKDYLSSRNDMFEPLGGQEFRLIQEKDGLSCLHKSLTSEFHPDKSSYAIIQFIELAKRLGKSSKKLSIPPKLGYQFSSRIPNYNKEVNNFIQEITSCSFKITHLRDLLSLNTFDWIRYMNGRLPKFSNLEKPIPVTHDEFMKKAEDFISSLFFENSAYPKDKQGFIFDQAGSFWSPLSSTQYFGSKRKTIVVSRDPRDIYTQNINLYGASASDFINYHNSIMKHISNNEWSHESILHIKFEKFVQNYDEEYKLLCDFLDIDYLVKSNYDPELSKKNIGVYKNYLTEEDSNLILHNCLEVGIL